MLVPSFLPNISLADNAIDKSRYLPCIQHENQNDFAYGCRVTTRIVRQPPILKVTELQCLSFDSNKDFNLYLLSNAEGEAKSNQLILCLCQRSSRQRKAFNFNVIVILNNRIISMSLESPQHMV